MLPGLRQEFLGAVDLIYIDPPFATRQDLSLPIHVHDMEFTKEPSMIEVKAYRDTWGSGLDTYLQWFSETVGTLHDLLSDGGSLIVHLDYRVGQYAKVVLDELFTSDRLVTEIIWHYSGAEDEARLSTDRRGPSRLRPVCGRRWAHRSRGHSAVAHVWPTR